MDGARLCEPQQHSTFESRSISSRSAFHTLLRVADPRSFGQHARKSALSFSAKWIAADSRPQLTLSRLKFQDVDGVGRQRAGKVVAQAGGCFGRGPDFRGL